ncbi:uncharacterized protein METZ01_LOCUS132469 [marine metagenome]|uniref:Uncharacterized protein n=1 Tax=marine metagenome TaxID=408172 RepID=A0A381YRH4_9ZZZZ
MDSHYFHDVGMIPDPYRASIRQVPLSFKFFSWYLETLRSLLYDNSKNTCELFSPKEKRFLD